MKLPCERFVCYSFLRGLPLTYVLKLLDELGYILYEINPKTRERTETWIVEYVKDLQEQITPLVGNDLATRNFLTNAKLLSLWHDERCVAFVHGLMCEPELRFAVECMLTSNFDPESARTCMLRSYKRDLPLEVIQLYAHSVWYLRGLSRWDLSTVFESHRAGPTYKAVYNMGHQLVLIKIGCNPGDIDREEELRYQRASAAIKYKELMASGGKPSDLNYYQQMFKEADQLLGPTETIQKLLKEISRIQPAMIDLKSVPIEKLGSLSGHSKGVAMLSDVVEAKYELTDGGETDPRVVPEDPSIRGKQR